MADVDNLRQRELEDLKSVLRTVEGRRFVWRFMGGVFHSSFSSDALIMAFREGERNAALRIQADVMEVCPDKFIQMQRESKKQQEIDNERNRNADD